MIGADVLDELYGADPGEFVATRTRLAKAARAAGDRETATRIGELRKPTLAAWAVNRLVRDRPAEVDALFAVGVQMREATAQLDMPRLRELRADRDRVLASFTRAARFVADGHGHPLSLDAATAVRATGVAALADQAAADAVAGGALVRTLDYAGFGEVDVSDAVAAQVVRRPAQADPGPAEADPAHASSSGRHDGVGADTPEETAGEGAAPSAPGTGRSGGTQRERGARRGGPPTPERSEGADRKAAEEAETQAAHRRAEAEARRRHAARLRQDLEHADRELARTSLVEAEARRRADKAERRRDELARLLEAATDEAREAAHAAEDATTEREAAAAAQETARARLAEIDHEDREPAGA